MTLVAAKPWYDYDWYD